MITADLNHKNILVIKYRALGDSILGLGAISYLKNIFPNSTIIYAIPDWVAPMFDHLESSADHIWPLSLSNTGNWIRSFMQFISLNSRVKIDLIYEFHQNGRSKLFFNLISHLFQKKYCFYNHHATSRAPAIQRDLDGLHLLNCDWPSGNYLDFPPRLMVKNYKEPQGRPQTLGPPPPKAFRIIFGVSATRDSKLWPIDHYIELANKLLAYNPQLKIEIPLSNSSRDRELEKRLEKALEQTEAKSQAKISLLKSSLSDLPLELARTPSLYIGSDSGIKHLCVALGIPTFTLFGPEEPYEWHPYPVEQHPFFFLEQLPCRTTNSHFCGKDECENLFCLKNISPDLVFNKILESGKL